MTVQGFLAQHWFSRKHLLQEIVILCSYLSVFPVLRKPHFSDGSRKVVDFSIFPAIYLLLGQNDSCQTLSMPDLKPEVGFCF